MVVRTTTTKFQELLDAAFSDSSARTSRNLKGGSGYKWSMARLVEWGKQKRLRSMYRPSWRMWMRKRPPHESQRAPNKPASFRWSKHIAKALALTEGEGEKPSEAGILQPTRQMCNNKTS